VGAAVIDAASRLRADIYFMGVTGVHPDAGLSTGDAEEAAVKRALHERAAELLFSHRDREIRSWSGLTAIWSLRSPALVGVRLKPDRSAVRARGDNGWSGSVVGNIQLLYFGERLIQNRYQSARVLRMREQQFRRHVHAVHALPPLFGVARAETSVGMHAGDAHE